MHRAALHAAYQAMLTWGGCGRTGQELVHVAEAKSQQRQPEFLVRDIARFQDIVKELTLAEPPAGTPRQPGTAVAGY